MMLMISRLLFLWVVCVVLRGGFPVCFCWWFACVCNCYVGGGLSFWGVLVWGCLFCRWGCLFCFGRLVGRLVVVCAGVSGLFLWVVWVDCATRFPV